MGKKRCNKCNIKLNAFSLFECECGKDFCIKHVHSFEHLCELDVRQKHKDTLKDKLPKIKKEKFVRI